MQQLTAPRTPWSQSLDFLDNPAIFVKDHFEIGDFYQVPLPFRRFFIVTSPEVLHHIFVKEEQRYEKSHIYWHQLRAIVGDSLGTTEGEDWVWMKRLQLPYFTHSAVAGYLPDVLRINEQFFQQWEKKKATLEHFDILQHFAEKNLATILKTIFDIEPEISYAETARFIAEGMATIAWRSKFPWRPWTSWLTGQNYRTARYLSYFDAFTAREIGRFKPTVSKLPTLMERLVLQMTATEDRSLTAKDIRNEIITHLGASTEAMALGECWTILLLMQHPHYQELIREEIEQVTGGVPLNAGHLPQLQLTERVIKESLRLYPPTHTLVRDCVTKSDEINGIRIKRGDTFFISTIGMHRNPRIWDAPDEFRPDRFLEENKLPKYAWIPFGVGRHTCIGRFLAMPQMVLTIAQFCRKFNFQRSENTPIKPVSLATLKPDHNIFLNLTAR